MTEPKNTALPPEPVLDIVLYRLAAVLVLACGAVAAGVRIALPPQDGPLILGIFG